MENKLSIVITITDSSNLSPVTMRYSFARQEEFGMGTNLFGNFILSFFIALRIFF